MKISFHGAARTVTGSKHLITTTNGKKYLLDCGLFQGLGKNTDEINREWGFDPMEIDSIILSHAHIDHSGLIPKMYKDGYKGKVHCTHGTKALSEVLLEDSAKIQEEDTRHSNKYRASVGRPYIEPLYKNEHALFALENFIGYNYGEWVRIDEDMEIMFTDAGHIIGSAAVHLRINENNKIKKISFSGDIGRYRDIILKSPQPFPQADIIILESTYGDSLHEEIYSTPDHLLEWIEKVCLKRKGKLILPAFSVGRTQELLFSLNQLELERRLPDLKYYVDSPLSKEATMVVKQFPEYFNKSIQRIMQTDDDPFNFKGLHYIRTVEESKALNYLNDPCVIISASGMADAGRVKHHISNTVENSRNAVVFTGYCEPSSLGGRMQAGAKEIGIFGVSHQVNAEVGSIRSMSAHGDYEDLSQWLSCQDPQQIEKLFLVHGEYEVQLNFAGKLSKKGFQDIVIPQRHQEFGLG